MKLDCVFLGKPKPSVLWYRNDDLLSNVSTTEPASSGGYVQNELVIRDLGREDLHSELTCKAFNNNRTIPLVSTVHVDMNCKLSKRTDLCCNQKPKLRLIIFFSFLSWNIFFSFIIFQNLIIYTFQLYDS